MNLSGIGATLVWNCEREDATFLRRNALFNVSRVLLSNAEVLCEVEEIVSETVEVGGGFGEQLRNLASSIVIKRGGKVSESSPLVKNRSAIDMVKKGGGTADTWRGGTSAITSM